MCTASLSLTVQRSHAEDNFAVVIYFLPRVFLVIEILVGDVSIVLDSLEGPGKQYIAVIFGNLLKKSLSQSVDSFSLSYSIELK